MAVALLSAITGNRHCPERPERPGKPRPAGRNFLELSRQVFLPRRLQYLHPN
jgi:hypothetical protein